MIQYLSMSKEQTHPLHATDKIIIDSLISKKEPEDLDLINLARLINRYGNFPGEFEIKNDIEKILKFWKKLKILRSRSPGSGRKRQNLFGSEN